MDGKWDALRWRCLERREVFSDRWMHLEARRMELPQGQIVEPFYVIGGRDWACALPVLPDGRLVLVAQYRCGAGQVTWEFPAGVIDAGEDAMETARRELREETGFRARGDGRLIARVCPETVRLESRGVGYLFEAEPEQEDQTLDESEGIEVVICEVQEVIEAQQRGLFCHGAHVGFFYQALAQGWLQGR